MQVPRAERHPRPPLAFSRPCTMNALAEMYDGDGPSARPCGQPSDVRLDRTRYLLMEKLVDTVVQRFDKPPLSTQKDACLVHIYPTGPWMGMRHALASQPLIVGRGEDCEIRVLDTSVSRRHARVERIGDDFFVLDMQSTNGTYVNDRQSLPGDPIPMRDGDYLRVGNCIFRYLASGNVEADYHEEIYRLT